MSSNKDCNYGSFTSSRSPFPGPQSANNGDGSFTSAPKSPFPGPQSATTNGSRRRGKREQVRQPTPHNDEDRSSDEDSSEEESEDMDDSMTAAEHKELGNQAYKLKDYRGAIAQYTLAIETAQAFVDKALTDADSFTTESKKEAVDLKKELSSYYANRAAAFTMLLKYREAIEDCDKSLETDPTNLKSHVRKARVLISQGELDRALRAFSMGLVRDPNNTTLLTERKAAEQLKNKFQLANDFLVKAHSGDAPSGSRASQNAAELTRRKAARHALAYIESVLEKCSQWNAVQLLKIDALTCLNRTEEAYSLSTKLMRLGMSDNTDLLFVRAQCLAAMGDMEPAQKHLKQILSSDPDNKKAFAFHKQLKQLMKAKEEADAKYKSKNFAQAVEAYGKAIVLASSASITATPASTYTAKLYYNRALCHNYLRQHEDCARDCTSAIACNNQYTKAYIRRAASNLLAGGEKECQSAINDYEKLQAMVSDETEIREYRKKAQAAKIQLKRAKRKDLYKILGVSRDATENEVKKAYRKMALKYHPDRQSKNSEEDKTKAEALFRDVNLANEILSDAQKRRRYDEGVDEQDIDNPDARPDAGGHGHGHGGMGGGMDPDILFDMFMRQQAGRGGGGGGGFHFG
jgi:DnaJ family protein C protein 7